MEQGEWSLLLRVVRRSFEVEDMDETIAPSGTVNPNKAVDNIGEVAPSDTLESSGEDFPASPHMHRRVAPLRRTSIPNNRLSSKIGG